MPSELILHQTATAIRKQLPSIEDQYDYQQKLSALKQYAKNKDFYVAQLEAEVAMAQTLPDAMKQGDVKAERNSKGQPKYVLGKVPNSVIDNAHVVLWRQVAAISARERSQYYASKDRPTRKGLLRWHKNQNLADPEKPDAKNVKVLLADPPWQYDFAETDTRAVENQYPTATPEDIAGHLEEWGPGLAKDCALFLWATAPKLREALEVMEAWGFTYKTHAVWDKERMGMGYWFRGQHELLLVGVRGKFSPPDAELRVSSVFRERRDNKHSKKPVCVYEAIERMFPNVTKFEMYQREPRKGWLGGGNENPNEHDFNECLQKSHEAHDLPIWEQMYRQAFPDMLAMHDHRDDGYWQRAGIDRSVILRSSKQILIDEKVRGRNRKTGKIYQDIAIEHVSNDRTGAPGWAEKPLAADYIAYAIAPLGQGYLLPVPHFQAAWRLHKDDWLERFHIRKAPNKGYDTLFCPVPVAVLFKAMGQQLRLIFDPVEWTE